MEELKVSKNLRKRVKYRLRYFTNPTIDNIIDIVADEYNIKKHEYLLHTINAEVGD